jgi:type III secretory pathway component EscS
MSPELAVAQGLALTAVLLVPLALAAATGGAAAGMLASWLGVQDQTVSLVARFLCVGLVLWFFAGDLGERVLELTTTLWRELPSAGQQR